MAIRINTQELKTLLEIVPADQNIMLIGKHGIGKSQILEEFFNKKGQKVVSLFLGQMSDPGDLTGLLRKNDNTGKTEFMPPYWFPTDGKPIVLFLDELNRARPEVLQTIMDLALNKTLAGRKLPDGSRIISAVNNGDEYQLTALDPALVSRFDVYEFAPTSEEWIFWAKEKGLNNTVITFISENPEYLDGEMLRKEDMDLEKSPDRRGWQKVSQIMDTFTCPASSDSSSLENVCSAAASTTAPAATKSPSIYKKIVAGIVGVQAATAYFESLKKNQQLTGRQLIEQDFSVSLEKIKNYSTPQLAILTDSIFKYLAQADVNASMQNVMNYYNYLTDGSKPEALGYFASVFTQDSNAEAAALLAQQLPELADKLVEYISQL